MGFKTYALCLALLFYFLVPSVPAQTSGPENGVLYIHGGGQLNLKEFVQLTREVSGKAQPSIVVITTAQGPKRKSDFENEVPFPLVNNLKTKHHIKNVSELYNLKSEAADQQAAYERIDAADAVFMTGGNQCYLTEAFLDSKSIAAMNRLLARGGVIGGSSAGAQVQSSFMTRGDFKRREILGDTKHQTGFDFVSNCAFDVHVEERNREEDLLQLLTLEKGAVADRKIDPSTLLGIGIDQGTAVIIRKNIMQVTGRGHAYVFDPSLWKNGIQPFYDTLDSGDRYDLQERKRCALP